MFKRITSKYDYLTASILFIKKFVFLLLRRRSFTFRFIKTSEEFETLYRKLFSWVETENLSTSTQYKLNKLCYTCIHFSEPLFFGFIFFIYFSSNKLSSQHYLKVFFSHSRLLNYSSIPYFSFQAFHTCC